MPVQLRSQQAIPVRRPLVRRIAERALRALEASDGELSILLVDDAQMRALNRRYRRLDRSTDVLAFPQRCDSYPILLGDVVLSVETAARRAGRAPRALHRELARYLLHGILHLRGWDHHAPGPRRQMRRQAQTVWSVAWDDGDFGGASGTR